MGTNLWKILGTRNLYVFICTIYFVLVALTLQPQRRTFARETNDTLMPQLKEKSTRDSRLNAWTGIMSCPVTQDTIWEEWRQCQSIALSKVSNGETFDEFIVRNGARLPWNLHSNQTAVLLEFRDIQSRVSLIINNMIINLPVLWRVQVLGGDAVCRLMRRLFPHEVAAGKIVVTHIDKDNVEQVRPIIQ
jgi:hypothetical protein